MSNHYRSLLNFCTDACLCRLQCAAHQLRVTMAEATGRGGDEKLSIFVLCSCEYWDLSVRREKVNRQQNYTGTRSTTLFMVLFLVFLPAVILFPADGDYRTIFRKIPIFSFKFFQQYKKTLLCLEFQVVKKPEHNLFRIQLCLPQKYYTINTPYPSSTPTSQPCSKPLLQQKIKNICSITN